MTDFIKFLLGLIAVILLYKALFFVLSTDTIDIKIDDSPVQRTITITTK
jgi:hypothetical protein